MTQVNASVGYFRSDGTPTVKGQQLFNDMNLAASESAAGLAQLTGVVAGLSSASSANSSAHAANLAAITALQARVTALEAKLAAIAAVSSPTGGMATDLQARAAINSIIAGAA